MNDLTRQKLDAEIARLEDKIKNLDAATEQYNAVSQQIVKFTELANKDDEARNKYEIEQEKLEAEANLEAAKRGFESEKLEAEAAQRKVDARRSYIHIGITSAVTVITFVGTWLANARSQYKAEYFESTGHAYTSRANRWMVKEPVHPSPVPKK